MTNIIISIIFGVSFVVCFYEIYKIKKAIDKILDNQKNFLTVTANHQDTLEDLVIYKGKCEGAFISIAKFIDTFNGRQPSDESTRIEVIDLEDKKKLN